MRMRTKVGMGMKTRMRKGMSVVNMGIKLFLFLLVLFSLYITACADGGYSTAHEDFDKGIPGISHTDQSIPGISHNTVFIFKYISYAWGYQNRGFVIDSSGNIKPYEIEDRSFDRLRINDQLAYYDSLGESVGTVDISELYDNYQKLQKVDEKKLNYNSGNITDFGLILSIGVRFKDGAYEYVILGTPEGLYSELIFIVNDENGEDIHNWIVKHGRTMDAAIYARGEKVDAEVLLYNGEPLFPVRAVFRAMGASVDWDSDKRRAFVQNEVAWSHFSLSEPTSIELHPTLTLVEKNGRLYSSYDLLMLFGYIPVWNETRTRLDVYQRGLYVDNLPNRTLNQSEIFQGGSLFTHTKDMIDYTTRTSNISIGGVNIKRERMKDSLLDDKITEIEKRSVGVGDIHFYATVRMSFEDSLLVNAPQYVGDVLDISNPLSISILPGHSVHENQVVVVRLRNVQICAAQDAYEFKYDNIEVFQYKTGEQIFDFYIRNNTSYILQRLFLNGDVYFLNKFRSRDRFGEAFEYGYYWNLCTGEPYAKDGKINELLYFTEIKSPSDSLSVYFDRIKNSVFSLFLN